MNKQNFVLTAKFIIAVDLQFLCMNKCHFYIFLHHTKWYLRKTNVNKKTGDQFRSILKKNCIVAIQCSALHSCWNSSRKSTTKLLIFLSYILSIFMFVHLCEINSYLFLHKQVYISENRMWSRNLFSPSPHFSFWIILKSCHIVSLVCSWKLSSLAAEKYKSSQQGVHLVFRHPLSSRTRRITCCYCWRTLLK